MQKTWYDLLINYIHDPIKSLFKINTTKDYSKSTRVNNVNGGGKKPKKLKLKTTLRQQLI